MPVIKPPKVETFYDVLKYVGAGSQRDVGLQVLSFRQASCDKDLMTIERAVLCLTDVTVGTADQIKLNGPAMLKAVQNLVNNEPVSGDYWREAEEYGRMTDRELVEAAQKWRASGHWVWHHVVARRLYKLAGKKVPSWCESGTYSLSDIDELLEKAERNTK